jgi:hypothetical protein
MNFDTFHEDDVLPGALKLCAASVFDRRVFSFIRAFTLMASSQGYLSMFISDVLNQIKI